MLEKIKKIQPEILAFVSAFLFGISRLDLHLGFLSLIAFVPLFVVFEKNIKPKRLFFASIVFEITFTVTALHWISLVTIPGFFGMFILFGFYFYLLFLIINFVWHSISKFRFFAFIIFWLSLEFLSNYGEFRFPWFNIGYSFGEYLHLIQIAEFGGVFLVSLMIILLNIFIFRSIFISKRNLIYGLIIFVIWYFIGFYIYNNIEVNETKFKVSFAQGSIPQDLKWEQSEKKNTFDIYEKQTIEAAMDSSKLIIWPESAAPVYLMLSPYYQDKLMKMATQNHINIFTGFPHVELDENENYIYYNSASLIDTFAVIHRLYYKNILVPFGERMPFMNKIKFLSKLDFGQANWEYGKEHALYRVGNYTFSPTICFEIAFPGLFADHKNFRPDFFVNITNDAWFNRSNGTYQHALMTRFRAIETRKEIIRAANTGYSMFTSPKGDYLEMTKLYEKTHKSRNLILINKRNTFFIEYYKLYLFSTLVLSVIIFLYAWIEKRFLKENNH